VQSAVTELQDALAKLAVHAIAERDVADVEELISNEVERVTEQGWSDEDIVEQVRLDKIEAGGGKIEAAEEEDEKPLITLPNACHALTELGHLVEKREGKDFDQARALFKVLKKQFRCEIDASKAQSNLHMFFK
ncbi:hypothetical protein BJV74DRAFT_714856, partial [Russula compacta]